LIKQNAPKEANTGCDKLKGLIINHTRILDVHSVLQTAFQSCTHSFFSTLSAASSSNQRQIEANVPLPEASPIMRMNEKKVMN